MGISYEGIFLNKISKDLKIIIFIHFHLQEFILPFNQITFKPNDEIIFSAIDLLQFKICCELNLDPVLVDIETDHMTINPELIKKYNKKNKSNSCDKFIWSSAYWMKYQK